MKTKIAFPFGEFRDRNDEKPLTASEHLEISKKSYDMHKDIDYEKVIADLENKLTNAKEEDKADIQYVLLIAQQQQRAGYGITK